ncbi:MAG: hypothetical protein K0S28_359 [Paucimonas sp.]|nr:hypothetical protein [Paucimonas sp.]
MRIQIASDLHLENLAHTLPGYRAIAETASDVLVLAGDIHEHAKVFDTFADWPTPVVYVHGNHELYNDDLAATQARLRSRGGPGVEGKIRFLENEEWISGGVRFLGACLWTDYELCGDPADAMALATAALNDHRLIHHGADGQRFMPDDALRLHRQTRTWLHDRLTRPFDGKTIVVTHHCPHPKSVHPKYGGNPLNAAFASDLTPLVGMADVWIHGHTHSSFDYRLGRCRVVCNPRGYCLRHPATEPGRLKFENEEFNPALVIEV